MTEIQTNVSNAEIIFGVQLDNMIKRHHDLLYYNHSQNGIGEMYPQLRGHERAIVKALGFAIVERISVMDQVGAGGLAREIVQARRTDFESKITRIHR